MYINAKDKVGIGLMLGKKVILIYFRFG